MQNIVTVKEAENRTVFTSPDNTRRVGVEFITLPNNSWLQSRIDCGDLMLKDSDVTSKHTGDETPEEDLTPDADEGGKSRKRRR